MLEAVRGRMTRERGTRDGADRGPGGLNFYRAEQKGKGRKDNDR